MSSVPKQRLKAIQEVVKRDGRIEVFDEDRIKAAVSKAILATRGKDFLEGEGKDLPDKVQKSVLRGLVAISEERPHVEEIQNLVEQALMQLGLYDVAKAYVLYRKERERIRDEKKRLLEGDHVDEVAKGFSLNAIRLLASRYLLRNEVGKIIEGPKEMFQRVASLIVIPDILHDARVFDKDGKQQGRQGDEINDSRINHILGSETIHYKFPWNKHHLKKMRELYEELNEKRQMKFSWNEFVDRLAKGDFESYSKNFLDYYNLMVNKEFMPNSPTLFNAGAVLGQLSACFVIPIEDNIESIMKSATECAIIFKSGGGVGINYSALRPEGDVVASTGGIASGPVTFMRIIDTVTDVVKQGGKRRGANMGILEISHPDIETFIRSKYETKYYENFNISVLIPREFWRNYEEGAPWPLVNPRNQSVMRTVNPVRLFKEISSMAWNTADPGVVFRDNINENCNPLKDYWGDITCTNPCGEEPMYPYESCNLGSINLYAFVKRRKESVSQENYFDWDALEECVKKCTRFLDNVIDVNSYPVQEIGRVSKDTRRVGLGVMGLADTLYAIGIPYTSEEGFDFMSTVAEFLAFHSTKESIELAETRGSFPLYEHSSFKKGILPFDAFKDRKLWRMKWDDIAEEVKQNGIRNSHTVTVAPTGSISMIVDVSSGLEPQFALVFEKHVSVGSFYYTDPELERTLADRGLLREDLLKRISENGGSIQGLDQIDEELKKIFVVAYDVPWWDHVRAQYEMQKWISASVSKTINMPAWVTTEDVEKAYIFAYKLGLKGVTIYRDGSKDKQVLRVPSQRVGKYITAIHNETIDMMKRIGIEVASEQFEVQNLLIQEPSLEARRTVVSGTQPPKCPTCSSENIVSQEGCRKCLECGWSTCTVA